MKFKRIEPINQVENDLFVRHKVEELEDGNLIQKCICCGEIIANLTPNPNSFSSNKDFVDRGYSTGHVYVKKSGNCKVMVSDFAIKCGMSVPSNVIDCAVINS